MSQVRASACRALQDRSVLLQCTASALAVSPNLREEVLIVPGQAAGAVHRQGCSDRCFQLAEAGSARGAAQAGDWMALGLRALPAAAH